MFLPIKTQPRWDQLLAPLFHGSPLWDAAESGAGRRLPSMNVWETAGAFHAEVDLPRDWRGRSESAQSRALETVGRADDPP